MLLLINEFPHFVPIKEESRHALRALEGESCYALRALEEESGNALRALEERGYALRAVRREAVTHFVLLGEKKRLRTSCC